ncbi:hypothetical protein GCM10017673_09390 [Streptosporangium violaceochromogenes]|nr:hypothetical protein GCM10017673_09390 [Streptosporangium violaceochromogenes]
MTAQPQDVVPSPSPMPEKNLRAIRAALVVPQDREVFDVGLKAVLDEVRVSLDLGALNTFVHRWWISACDSVRDPEGRRRMGVSHSYRVAVILRTQHVVSRILMLRGPEFHVRLMNP